MSASPYSVPKERGRWRGLGMAALVHLFLVALLWAGVSWQSNTPTPVEAEIWSPKPQAAAPRPAPPAVEQPPPVQKPVPTTPPPEKVAPQPDPDIALEQEKKRKQEEVKKRAETQEKERQQQAKLAEEKKRAEEQAAKEKAAKEKVAREKAAADERARQARLKAERDAAEQVALEKARADEISRLQSAVGSGGSGIATRSQGATDAGYAGRIRALIVSNTVFNVPPTLEGNPAAEYVVELLPDGSLRNAPRKIKSSGVSGFDEAVLRAIEKSQPFPRDSKGNIPTSLTISHRPKN